MTVNDTTVGPLSFALVFRNRLNVLKSVQLTASIRSQSLQVFRMEKYLRMMKAAYCFGIIVGLHIYRGM